MTVSLILAAAVLWGNQCAAQSVTTPVGMPRQVSLFRAGEDGYHSYRIPALLATERGTILAFCEGRRNSRNDHGDIDLILKRSRDGGRTWSDHQVVWGEEGEVTIGNPCPVQDRSTGTVWLGFCRDNDRVFITHSEDEGATWADPREITQDVKLPDWTWYATGPVHGIQLKCGRLLLPCDHRVQGDKLQYSHAIFSDDHGANWRLGETVAPKTDECVAVELDDGSVYMNMRSYEGKHRRAVAWSQDKGMSWSPVVLDEALVEPACQGSALTFRPARSEASLALFSNPASERRERMTVRVSRDGCRTWSVGRVLHEGPAAYSDLAALPDDTLLCLYECGEKNAYETITLAQFSVQWLEGKE